MLIAQEQRGMYIKLEILKTTNNSLSILHIYVIEIMENVNSTPLEFYTEIMW